MVAPLAAIALAIAGCSSQTANETSSQPAPSPTQTTEQTVAGAACDYLTPAIAESLVPNVESVISGPAATSTCDFTENSAPGNRVALSLIPDTTSDMVFAAFDEAKNAADAAGTEANVTEVSALGDIAFGSQASDENGTTISVLWLRGTDAAALTVTAEPDVAVSFDDAVAAAKAIDASM